MAKFGVRTKAVIIWLSAVTLSAALASPANTATSPENTERPLGILLSPQIIGNSSTPSVENGVAPDTPPLGILFNSSSTMGAIQQVAPILGPDSIPATPLTSLPGYSKQIPRPNATNDRPLGQLMNPEVMNQLSPQPVPAHNAIAPPLVSIISSENSSWNTSGNSSNIPLGTLMAPTPKIIPVEEMSPTSAIAAPIMPAPLPSPPVWETTGQSQSLPLGTLFMPDTPLPVYRSQDPEIPADNAPGDFQKDTDAANFSADKMTYDRGSKIVTAEGNVEIQHLTRSLRADKVTYDQETGIIQAIGGVSLSEPTGEIIYGERIEISGDLRDGIIKDIGIILQDRSRLAANGAKRSNGLVTELSKGVYSPCSLCAKDPTRPPLWQIKAVKVVHDQTRKVVEYEDAWIELFGYPVFYTPYFRHPDPTIKRQSGFLFSTIGNSSDLGTILQTPYFWNISPHEDLTVTPMIMTSANPALNLEYRKKLNKGEIEFNSSITKSDDSSDATDTENGDHGVRGYMSSEGRFDINSTWRWGFDAKRTTDDTYMRRYGFSSPNSLNSKLFTEAFRQNSYFSASTHSFQGLASDDDQGTTPLVLPLIDFNHVGDRDRFGGTSSFDFNFLALTRDEGTDTRRVSMQSRWQRPIVGSFGDIYTFSLGVNGAVYHTNSLSRGSSQTEYSGVSYRAIPEASLDWRLPFAKSNGNISQTLEPIASLVWSPYGGNSIDIPNEDSNELEFDDTNLFSTNRFSGLDRVEGGPRVSYGLKWGIFGSGGGSTRVMVGQSWRPKTDDTYSPGSGLEENFSDIVSRVDVTPGEYLNLSYRTRFSAENLNPNRNEITVSAGIPAFTTSANYVFLDQQTDSEFSGREEINYSVSSKINRFWRTRFSGVRDMAASEFRSAGLQLVYEDECVILTTSATRTFFEDRDIEPTDSITFRLLLKTLGEVHSGFTQS